MSHIYLDNAATTPMLPEVIETMTDAMKNTFGNPSSTHQIGRTAKAMIENARKNIASHFGASASEILFTAGGSEADNFVLKNAVENLGVTTIISSKIEHKAILETIYFLEKKQNIEALWVDIDEKGMVNEEHLKELLTQNEEKKLVSLMYVNNEIGTLLPLQRIATICKENDALFHSDTVQRSKRHWIFVRTKRVESEISTIRRTSRTRNACWNGKYCWYFGNGKSLGNRL